MKLEGIELRRIEMPLVAPFRTSFGTETVKQILLVRAVTTHAQGWGECVADAIPAYSSEYVDAATHVIRDHFIPALAQADDISMWDVAEVLGVYKGHPMAKAALEMAIMDAQLRSWGVSFREFLGGRAHRVPAGVSVGIMGTVDELLDAVDGYITQGYVRIKLKIEPGWDIAPVRAVRERFGDDLQLQVDANTAYRLHDARTLAGLDAFGLLLIEQPLPEDDLRGHAALAAQLTTPICLDESIVSARSAADAIALGATSVVNIKPGRVGGYLEARRIHDVCAAHGVPVWCGGMLESGIGRAGNIALASLPNFTLPGDTSASDRYYTTDITSPFVLQDGHVTVPTGDGLGVEPDRGILDRYTVSTQWISFTGS